MRNSSDRRVNSFALALCVLLSTFLLGTGSAQQRRGGAASTKAGVAAKSQREAKARTRLVLLIAVDQFRYDFLERFDGLYSASGIGRLLRGGASWTGADYDHTPTYTAPGHATLMTGTWPRRTARPIPMTRTCL